MAASSSCGPDIIRSRQDQGDFFATYASPSSSPTELREDWELIDRLSDIFQTTIPRESFSFACECAFNLAFEACRRGQVIELKAAERDITLLTNILGVSLLHRAVESGEHGCVIECINSRFNILATVPYTAQQNLEHLI